MKPRICICCGDPMLKRGNALSRNPNVCASCSSLADGIDDTFAGEHSEDQHLEPPAPGMEVRSGLPEPAIHLPAPVDFGRKPMGQD